MLIQESEVQGCHHGSTIAHSWHEGSASLQAGDVSAGGKFLSGRAVMVKSNVWLLVLVVAIFATAGRGERPLESDSTSEFVLRHVEERLRRRVRTPSSTDANLSNGTSSGPSSNESSGENGSTTRAGNASSGVGTVKSHAAAVTPGGVAVSQSQAKGDMDAASTGNNGTNSSTSDSHAKSGSAVPARKSRPAAPPSLASRMGGSLGSVGQVSLDGSQDIPANALEGDLIASVNNSQGVSFFEFLTALVGGTGATIGGTGDLQLDQDLVRRMRYQDKAVMLLLLVMYFVTLGFSASFAYRQALNDSPVTFYADPRYHDMVSEGHDVDTFLEAFNQSPKDVQLQVTGFVPVPAGVLGSIEWHGEYYYDAFSFALDLSPWVVREGTNYPSESEGAAGHDGHFVGDRLVDGIVAQDMDYLRYHICRDTNDLAIIDFRKEVSWPSWEELATNIKHRIRQSGFNGIISVHRTECDSVSIYKNTPWANFMHSRTTKVLCALSVLGWIFYLPYMWWRCKSSCIRSRYFIDVSIDAYWQLIADKLSADGFVEERDHDASIADNAGVGASFRQGGGWIPQSEFVRFGSISLGDPGTAVSHGGAPDPVLSSF